MASSAHKPHHHLPTPYGTTSAPPPTPSSHNNLRSTPEAADAFSCLLHRLTPTLTLSLSTRRSSPQTTTTTTPPIINLSDPTESLHSNILSATSQLGFFQLTHHSIPSQLAHSAESESLSLFNLSHHEKQQYFPKNWPLGYEADDDNDNDEEESTTSGDESFCLDSSCSAESTELSLTSLREFTAEMEKLGLEVVEALTGAYGFVNPARQDATQVCPLMWISQGSTNSSKPEISGRMYPYVVGLQYQIHRQWYSVLTDAGWASISSEVDSVLVTLGDIAQVWSNGKLKKVRGRPVADNSQHCISMTMLITLPIDSIVSPLLPLPKPDSDGNGDEISHEDDEGCSNTSKEERIFNSFSFEDYAWRIYHERLHSKDPLIRYRA